MKAGNPSCLQPIYSMSIRSISPYRHEGEWVFDDPATGLVKEPFVGGMDEIIDELVRSVPDPEAGFRLLFRDFGFPTAVRLDWVRPEDWGNVYRSEELGMEGWLCSALLRYFPKAPKELYLLAVPRPGLSWSGEVVEDVRMV